MPPCSSDKGRPAFCVETTSGGLNERADGLMAADASSLTVILRLTCRETCWFAMPDGLVVCVVCMVCVNMIEAWHCTPGGAPVPNHGMCQTMSLSGEWLQLMMHTLLPPVFGCVVPGSGVPEIVRVQL